MHKMLLIILLFSAQLMATEKTLKIAVNIGPPWAYYDQEKGVTGIDVEIIRLILNNLGYETEFYLLSYNRLIKDFNDGKFDLASPAAFDSEIGFLSETYLPFEDVVVSLSKHKLIINNIDDLQTKTIVAYQYATSVLGSYFANTVKKTKYLELAEREVQLKLLVNNRTDVVIGERRLLTYINKTLFPNETITIHPIFLTRPYGAILKDKQLQERYDEELQNLINSGAYQDILDRWP